MKYAFLVKWGIYVFIFDFIFILLLVITTFLMYVRSFFKAIVSY